MSKNKEADVEFRRRQREAGLIQVAFWVTPEQAEAIKGYIASGKFDRLPELSAADIVAIQGDVPGVEFAKELGVTPASLSRWRSGAAKPRGKALAALLAIRDRKK